MKSKEGRCRTPLLNLTDFGTYFLPVAKDFSSNLLTFLHLDFLATAVQDTTNIEKA